MRAWIAAIVLGVGVAPWLGHAEPADAVLEDIEQATISGSIDAGGEFISYTIDVERASGTYLAGTERDPASEYTTTVGCISFEATFFSDSGCKKIKKLKKFTLDEELNRAMGSFTVRTEQFGLRVKISFTVRGKGTANEDPRLDYAASQAAMDVEVATGPWARRSGKPKGSLEVVGYPSVSISGSASIARGTLATVAADL